LNKVESCSKDIKFSSVNQKLKAWKKKRKKKKEKAFSNYSVQTQRGRQENGWEREREREVRLRALGQVHGVVHWTTLGLAGSYARKL
jgi:hypothetical protein